MNLEDELRSTLTNQRRALPSWPDPVTRVRAGVTRRRRRRYAVVAGAVAAALLLAVPGVGLGRRVLTAPAANGVVPWMDGDDLGAPAPVATPLPRATGKACIGPDLDATATVYKTSTSGSDPLTIIAVTKMTAGRCTLAGQPGVVAAHGTLPVWAAGPHPLPAVGVAGVEQPTTIDKGEQALVTIVADHRCASSGSVTDVSLQVLGRQVPVAGVTYRVGCQVAVGQWYRELKPDVAPARYTQLTASITAPARVAAGARLDYRVTLANPTDHAIALDPCPLFSEELGKHDESHQLNCAPGSIPAHGSVTFAMRITAPHLDPDFQPPGPTTLDWGITESGQLNATAHAPITLR